jgi:Holliday junction resolvasome RuvABC ATP-dependent DNA helicase subunit
MSQQAPQQWASDLCNQYKGIDTESTALRQRVSTANELLMLSKERIPTFRFLSAASDVLTLAEHAVANMYESHRLADRIARISFFILEAMSVKEWEGSTKSAEVQHCINEIEAAFGKASTLLRPFQDVGNDLSGMTVIERFKATHRMYFPDRVGAFAQVHKDLTDILRTAGPLLLLQNLERCAAPVTDDIRNTTKIELIRVVREVEPVQHTMDIGMSTALERLKLLLSESDFA